MIEQHYSPKQLADLLSVSPMTISRMVKAGKFEVVRCGHRVIIPESAVLRYLDANRIKVKGDIPLGSTSQAPSKLLESTFQQPPRRGRRPLISYL
ncbi:MAG: DNA-binding protein [Spartobacteria bacterium]|nr:DNA-binding protein [Spartobacteria bacterium]